MPWFTNQTVRISARAASGERTRPSITRRVVPTFFECTAAERGALMALVGEVKALLAELENLRGTPDSFRPDEPATASRHTRSVAKSGRNLVSHLLTTNGFVSHFCHESEKQRFRSSKHLPALDDVDECRKRQHRGLLATRGFDRLEHARIPQHGQEAVRGGRRDFR